MPGLAMTRRVYGLSLMFLGLCIMGCGPGETGSPKPSKALAEKAAGLSKVTGKITVNGQPSKVKIGAPLFAEGNYKQPIQTAITDKDGNINFSTVTTGDGLPPGKYVLGAIWGTVTLGGAYGGDDVFKGKFLDPANPIKKFEVVAGGKPVDLGTIDLKFDIPADAPAPGPFVGFDAIPGAAK